MVEMFLVVFCLCMGTALGAEFTLPGECPNVKLQENLDYTKFSGVWYNVASYASDSRPIYNCATLDFQEDNLGYTLRETYVVEEQGNRTQKSYFARVDPTFDAGNKAQFIVSHEDGDKVLQFPFFILSTDYDHYAIAYTCKTLKKKQRTHYVFAWVLSRTKDALQGEILKQMEDKLSKYTELAEHRQSFVFKDFSEASCSFSSKFESDFFTSNFCGITITIEGCKYYRPMTGSSVTASDELRPLIANPPSVAILGDASRCLPKVANTWRGLCPAVGCDRVMMMMTTDRWFIDLMFFYSSAASAGFGEYCLTRRNHCTYTSLGNVVPHQVDTDTYLHRIIILAYNTDTKILMLKPDTNLNYR